jgi:hypothetical protein
LLPIYDAITFESRIMKGGRTRPIIVTVRNEEGKLKQYVVKLYSKQDVQESFTVARDVLTVALADEFDLLSPQPAYIRFSKAFLQTLSKDLQEEIKQKNAYLNFGCEYLSGVNNFGKNISKNTLEGLMGIDTVFAFDNLVRNFDRRFVEKTNLLLLNHDIYLIDHEYCLSIELEHIEDLETQNWTYNYKNHVFYPFLSSHNKQTKSAYFNDFEELLKRLNVTNLDTYVTQLEELNFPMPDSEILKLYLQYTKQNSYKFVTLLKGILQ